MIYEIKLFKNKISGIFIVFSLGMQNEVLNPGYNF